VENLFIFRGKERAEKFGEIEYCIYIWYHQARADKAG
jgi:hypothetical protein